ncbi:uncharacterized protein LOC130446404 [Diorhabda sublineata]|uniref:uncharacterized protein LOC130446404 n=1 Tax=Diorhabda sublineata TaxID=1163346 RepID=UPI0024E14815|nr:uncharacterized protein LOC130446404 [Diorhabda sublineata]
MDVPWTSLVIQFILLLFVLEFTSTFKQTGSCYFPERWEGSWFQSGVRQSILIEGPRLSSKGRCVGSEGDKFLILDEKKTCYRCVVIHEKHINVLQYKETYCHSREVLPTLCGLITGDALLYSMFRENAVPIPCPFRGPFTFTYNRGHGECKYPVSSIDACIEESKLLLSYQACPDVHGSESAIEELQCLASWKEGSSRYLVGKIHHSHVTSNEDRYRCFVYEKTGSPSGATDDVDYRVAQSGDATCNGLFSATEGSRTMTLKKALPVNKCRFPSWIANSNHWHTLDYSSTYSFHHKNSTLKITNATGIDMKVICVQLKQTTRDENAVILVTHFTMGCQNGYICIAFYRRDLSVMEMQMGTPTNRREDACNSNFFDKLSLPFVTLVSTSVETQNCPFMGKFEVNNLIRNKEESSLSKYAQREEPKYFDSNFYFRKQRRSIYFEQLEYTRRRVKRVDEDFDCDSDSNGFSNLIIGCVSYDTMEFTVDCPTPNLITSYSCHGRWEENGTNYLITSPNSRSAYGIRKFCFMYKEMNSGVMFSTSAESCSRLVKPGITGELIFNISSTGKCFDTDASVRNHPINAWLMSSIFFSYIVSRLVTIR